MSFAAVWMDLDIIILNEVSKKKDRQIPYDITYTWNLNYDTNEFIYEIETDLQTQRTDLQFPRSGMWGEGWIGSLGLADANYYLWNR